MTGIDLLGSLASALVLATFCTRDLASLRLLAITSNLAFMVYAVLAGLHPVPLPVNLSRLAQARRDGRRLRVGRPTTTPEGSS